MNIYRVLSYEEITLEELDRLHEQGKDIECNADYQLITYLESRKDNE